LKAAEGLFLALNAHSRWRENFSGFGEMSGHPEGAPIKYAWWDNSKKSYAAL
jgi:hypothetical protein